MINNSDPNDRFVTTAQAAEIISVSIATLKKFILQGKLKAIKTPGGHYRIRMKDLMEELYQTNGAKPPGKGEK
jgi:excisionase family DNA binding protein